MLGAGSGAAILIISLENNELLTFACAAAGTSAWAAPFVSNICL